MEKRASVRVGYFLQIVCIIALWHSADAGCSGSQRDACLSAAKSKNWNTLNSAGKCELKYYTSEFTHICKVNNYRPSDDAHCCCAVEDAALCCTYHQNWNLFRCSAENDEIREITEDSDSLPLYVIIIIAVVGTVVLILAIYCIKRTCTASDSRSKSTGCAICGKKKPPQVSAEDPESLDQLSPLPTAVQYNRAASRVSNGNTERKLSSSSSNTSQPLLSDNSDTGTEPSAPSLDDVGMTYGMQPHICDGIERSHSQGYVQPEGHEPPGFVRSASAPVNPLRQHSVCPSCSSATIVAPPTYDESREHQILTT